MQALRGDGGLHLAWPLCPLCRPTDPGGDANPPGGGRCGGLRETACTGESGGALYGIDGGDLAAGGGGIISPAGKLLTGNIGSLCEQQPLKALRAPGGPTPQYKILHPFFLPRTTRHEALEFVLDHGSGDRTSQVRKVSPRIYHLFAIRSTSTPAPYRRPTPRRRPPPPPAVPRACSTRHACSALLARMPHPAPAGRRPATHATQQPTTHNTANGQSQRPGCFPWSSGLACLGAWDYLLAASRFCLVYSF
jgi:hypothetical protein